MINIWFLLGPVPTYRMGNGCNAIQNRLSSGRALCVRLAMCVCVTVYFCGYKGPVTACVWPGEIREQIGLQITTALWHPNKQWPLSDYHQQQRRQQWPWTQRSSWYWFWRDIMYRKKELHAAGWDALVALDDKCSNDVITKSGKGKTTWSGWNQKTSQSWKCAVKHLIMTWI